MTELPPRIRDLLRDPTDDLMQARIWRRMVAKSLAERNRRARLSRALPVWAAAAVVAIGVLFAAARAILHSNSQESLAPLRLENGEVLSALHASTEGAPVVREFSGGSRLILLPGASIRVAENDDTAAIFIVERGAASFELADDGRRWTLECGLATIEGTASKFFVEREERRLRVLVEAGAISVRGAGVQGGVQRLAAKMSLELALPSRAVTPLPDPIEEERADEGVVRRRVLAALTPRKIAKAEPSPKLETATELLARADQARLRGQDAEAAALFAELIDRYPNDLAAPIAAFTLGRVELENLHRPERAAIAFERALNLGLGVALREVALGHLADAHLKAGDPSRAKIAAARYLADYPQGRRAAEMKLLRDQE